MQKIISSKISAHYKTIVGNKPCMQELRELATKRILQKNGLINEKSI